MLAPNSGIFTFIANDVLISQNVNQFVYLHILSLSLAFDSRWCCCCVYAWLSSCLCFVCYYTVWPLQFDWTLMLMLYGWIYYKTILLPLALPLTILFQNMEIKVEQQRRQRQRRRRRWQWHCVVAARTLTRMSIICTNIYVKKNVPKICRNSNKYYQLQLAGAI